MNPKNSRLNTSLLLTLVSVCVLVGCLTEMAPPTPTPPSEIKAIVQVWSELASATPSPNENTIVEVWNSLSREFVDKNNLDLNALRHGAIQAMMEIDQQKNGQANPDSLREAAILGMLTALDDPYTTYLEPSEYHIIMEDIQGKFEGIGARVGFMDGQITILTPLPGTPAEREGIKAGDVVLEVNGASTEGWSLLDTVIKIRGAKGTPVDLLVRHVDDKTPTTIRVVRGVIQIESLYWEILQNGLALIKISEFADNTDEALSEALEDMQEMEVEKLILDLRNNSGGLLNTTVNIASQFLKDGLVFYIMDSDGNRSEYKVKPGGLAQDIPMVVLVNQFSASASEVLAGALQDHNRAILIGTSTFGKGSANIPKSLSDGSGLYFTIGRWYSPNDHLIEGQGLKPNIWVENRLRDDSDSQLQRAINYFTDQEVTAYP